MFHKLLFLGPGGRTVYQGSVENAKEYFESMDYPCPANINPADHYMDVIGGVVKKGDEKPDPKALYEAWINHAAQRNEIKTDNIDVEEKNFNGGGEELMVDEGERFQSLGTRATVALLKLYINRFMQVCTAMYVCMAMYVCVYVCVYVCMAMSACMAMYIWLCMYGYVCMTVGFAYKVVCGCLLLSMYINVSRNAIEFSDFS